MRTQIFLQVLLQRKVQTRLQVSFAAALFVGACTLLGCSHKNNGSGIADGDARVDPCAGSNPLTGCGEACGADQPCSTGLYCGTDSKCVADCDYAANSGCLDGYVCTNQGKCSKQSSVGDGGGPTGDANAAICADVHLDAKNVTPTVILIVDQSKSMQDNNFGQKTRWNAVRDALLDSNGLINTLQSTVRFGLALYSTRRGTPTQCPAVTTVPSPLGQPPLSNFTAIQAVYSTATPLLDTPTGESINQIRGQVTAPTAEHPVVFVVATDGFPDTCAQPEPNEGQPEALAAVRAAYQNGIRTYMIGVGTGVSADHLQDMANVGVGLQANDRTASRAKYYQPGDDQGLRAALTEIVKNQLSCVVPVSGTIALARACEGTVKLNGQALACNDTANGWRASDTTHIELLGTACTTMKSGAQVSLTAVFPCGTAVIRPPIN